MSSQTASPLATIGDHLRGWRSRRRLSQLDLALEAGISQKHLSFVESGRALPSRDMVLRLASQLDLPLRAQNVLLLSAGYAPVYPERSLDAPDLAAARTAIDLILAGHEPYPALAIDRLWTLAASNRAVRPLLALVSDPSLLQPPVNVLRLSLHPDGLAPHIGNFAQWRGHLLDRLRQQVDLTADPDLTALARDLAQMPPAIPATGTRRPGLRAGGGPAADAGSSKPQHAAVLVPLQLRTAAGPLSLISTTTVFGTPVEVTLSEIAIEAFFPADPVTARILRAMADDAAD